MDKIEELIAVEAIRNLKARYWYYVDTKNWTDLEGVFTRNAVWDARHDREFAAGRSLDPLPPVADAIAAGDPSVATGASGCVEFLRSAIQTSVTFHVGGAPVIEILDRDNATAVWPIFDVIDWGRPFKGYGHYQDRYERVQDEWKISAVQLIRFTTDGELPSAAASPRS